MGTPNPSNQGTSSPGVTKQVESPNTPPSKINQPTTLNNPPPNPPPTPPPTPPIVARVDSKLEAAENVCRQKQDALTKANEAAVRAHAELMQAQQEVARLKA